MKETLHYSLMKTHMALCSSIVRRSTDVINLVGTPSRVVEYLYFFTTGSAAEIAMSCEVSPHEIEGVLKHMLREKLLECSGHGADARYSLSSEGKLAANWLEMLLDGADEMALAGIEEAERDELMRLLAKVYNNVRRADIYPPHTEGEMTAASDEDEEE